MPFRTAQYPRQASNSVTSVRDGTRGLVGLVPISEEQSGMNRMDGDTACQARGRQAGLLDLVRPGTAIGRRVLASEIGRVMRKRRFAFLLLGDAMGFALACVFARSASMALWPDPSHDYSVWSRQGLTVLAVMLAILGFNLAARGHYAREVTIWDEAGDIIAACAFGLLVKGAIEYGIEGHASRF